MKRLKLEEKKIEYDFQIQRQKNQIELERLTLEKEKTEQYKNQMQLMQQMHEVVMMLVKK